MKGSFSTIFNKMAVPAAMHEPAAGRRRTHRAAAEHVDQRLDRLANVEGALLLRLLVGARRYRVDVGRCAQESQFQVYNDPEDVLQGSIKNVYVLYLFHE